MSNCVSGLGFSGYDTEAINSVTGAERRMKGPKAM